MKILKRNITFVLASLAALMVLAVVAVAQTGGDESSPGEGVPQVMSIEADAKAAMSVLDRSRTGDDAMPAEVAVSLGENPEFGMNPDLSRESIETLSNSVYVIPADGHVCSSLTATSGANVTCAETEDIAAGDVGPSTVTQAGGAIAIYGMVPNGVESVTVETGESSSDVVAVQDNAYYTVVPEGTALRSLSYAGPSGVVEFALYDPSQAFDR